MARKRKAAKTVSATLPAPVVEPSVDDDPSFLADVEDRIPAGLLDVEEAATVNRIWVEAYETLRDRWETDSANLYDAKERLARADAAAKTVDAVVAAAEALLDWMKDAPLDTIYPIVLLGLKTDLVDALGMMPAVDR